MPKRTTAALAALLAGAATAAAAGAAPTTLEGELGGAPYRIVVPDAWNGTLLVHAHGYRDKADGPGEVDDRSAPAVPSAALEAPLLALGYALAGSAYRDNGWAVKEGVHDTRALTSLFAGRFGRPETTLLWGFSLGSVVSLALAERGGYDGVIGACAVAAGSPRSWDGALAALLAYDVAFGMPAAWGTPGDVDDGLDFHTTVLAKVGPELASPANVGRWEFARLVTQVAGFGVPPPPGYYPGGLLTNVYFSTEARAELERRAGGAPAQNLTHAYWLPPGLKLYLATLGVDADALLTRMNAADYAAEPAARNYLRRYAEFTGRVHQPVLTLHTAVDTLVPPAHESAYAATLASAGRSGELYQAFTTGSGHCAFTGEQLVTAVRALEAWAKTGTRPTPASFPTALGFQPPGYAPPPWPLD